MFKRAKLDSAGEYKEQRKILPYSITPSDKGDAVHFNMKADIQNAHKAFTRREKAMAAFNNGSGDVRNIGSFKISETPKAKKLPSPGNGYLREQDTLPEVSIVTRIYNWFLNINY